MALCNDVLQGNGLNWKIQKSSWIQERAEWLERSLKKFWMEAALTSLRRKEHIATSFHKHVDKLNEAISWLLNSIYTTIWDLFPFARRMWEGARIASGLRELVQPRPTLGYQPL